MPYKIEKGHGCPASKPWAVVKKSDGKRMGCHETRDKAAKQIAAIEANERATVASPMNFWKRYFGDR